MSEPETVDLTTKGTFNKWFLTVWKPLVVDDLTRTLTESCRWWAGQRELCPETERLHYHFALDLKQPLTFGGVKRLFGITEKGDIWSLKVWGGAEGIQRIIAYVTKEDSRVEGPWSGGNLPSKKRRAGEVVVTMIREGRPDSEIVELFPFQARNIGLIREGLERTHVLVDRNSPPEVWFVHGDPGAGKTRKFFDMAESPRDIAIINMPPNTGTWFFNGYRQQRIAVLDDANPPTERNIVALLRLLDRYPIMVDTKGGFISFNSPIIGITTNLTWEQWVENLSVGHQLALRRRISHIEHMAAAPQSQGGFAPTEQP